MHGAFWQIFRKSWYGRALKNTSFDFLGIFWTIFGQFWTNKDIVDTKAFSFISAEAAFEAANEALVSWAGGASATDASGAAGASKTAFNSVYSPMVVHASHCSAQTEEEKNPTGNPTSAEFFNEVHSDNDWGHNGSNSTGIAGRVGGVGACLKTINKQKGIAAYNRRHCC